eukprot:6202086-Pleurochrysis_carterae.AAC.3
MRPQASARRAACGSSRAAAHSAPVLRSVHSVSALHGRCQRASRLSCRLRTRRRRRSASAGRT